MFKPTLQTLTLISLLTAFAGCLLKEAPNKDNVEIIIPDTSVTHKPNHWYLRVRNLRRELNLKNLELGADSIEIRIYEDGALWQPDRMIVIKNESGIWNSTLITYWTRTASQAERQFDSTDFWNQYYNEIVDSSETKNLKPDCSWNNLMDSLLVYKIFTLPQQEEIKGFKNNVNDGISYYFEIATKSKYKFYTYHYPDLYNDENNKQATNILKLISRHLIGISLCKYN